MSPPSLHEVVLLRAGAQRAAVPLRTYVQHRWVCRENELARVNLHLKRQVGGHTAAGELRADLRADARA